ncbi:unnamed protein product [Cuscuta campestris]|uniref:Integrase catalytic domain-containing protein n=1 Tax=Cuscuta campestris TaxID=132261 RepID=A0A484L3E6_9ASTE|nr:unnamed protein product [Cuscuta campestris]
MRGQEAQNKKSLSQPLGSEIKPSDKSSFKGCPSVSFSKEEVEALSNRFRFALIGRFRRRPPIAVVKNFLTRLGLAGGFTLGELNSNSNLINFEQDEDYQRLFLRKSWTLGKEIMVVTKWSPNLRPNEDSPIVPVWVSIPNLPIHLHDQKALFYITSKLGKPLKVDNATLNFSRPKAARVCIEIDVSKYLHQKIHVKHIDEDLFFEYCKDSWEEIPFHGGMQSLFKRLHHLKEKLSSWNKTHFGNIFNMIKEAEDEATKAEQLFEENPSIDNKILYNQKVAELQEVNKREHAFWKQKCNLKWLKDGDANTKFFHNLVKKKRRKQQITGLFNEQGQLVDKPDDMEALAINHFTTLFNSSEHCSSSEVYSQFLQTIPQIIEQSHNEGLMSLPTEDEIKLTVWNMEPNSSPGPDGFNINFFKHCWDIIKGDITSACQEVFLGIPLPKAASSSNICLLPKVDNAMKLNDFRPVCLSTVASKIATKCIASRLGRLLPLIIFDEQGAYVPRREIMDQILITKEMVHHINRKARGGNLIVKLNMAKAFDKLKWSYLLDILKAFGFSPQFIQMALNSLIYEDNSSFNPSKLIDSISSPKIRVVKWLEQPKGRLKLNVDASFSHNAKHGAAILRDDQGRFVGAASFQVTGTSPYQAEVNAAIKGITWALNFGLITTLGGAFTPFPSSLTQFAADPTNAQALQGYQQVMAMKQQAGGFTPFAYPGMIPPIMSHMQPPVSTPLTFVPRMVLVRPMNLTGAMDKAVPSNVHEADDAEQEAARRGKGKAVAKASKTQDSTFKCLGDKEDGPRKSAKLRLGREMGRTSAMERLGGSRPALSRRSRESETIHLDEEEAESALEEKVEEKAGAKKHTLAKSPFSARVHAQKLRRKFKLDVEKFTGKKDPNVHLDTFHNATQMAGCTDAEECLLFFSSLRGRPVEWFNSLPHGKIRSFEKLAEIFRKKYQDNCIKKKKFTYLKTVGQREKESLTQFLTRWRDEVDKLEEMDDKMAMSLLMNAFRSGDLYTEFCRRPPSSYQEAYNTAWEYAEAEVLNKSKKRTGRRLHKSQIRECKEGRAGGRFQAKERSALVLSLLCEVAGAESIRRRKFRRKIFKTSLTLRGQRGRPGKLQSARFDELQSARSDEPQSARSDKLQSDRSDDPQSVRSDEPQSARKTMVQTRSNANARTGAPHQGENSATGGQHPPINTTEGEALNQRVGITAEQFKEVLAAVTPIREIVVEDATGVPVGEKAGPAGSQGKKKKVRRSQKKKATKPNGKARMEDALSRLDEEDESSSFERASAFDCLGEPMAKKPRTSAFDRLQDTRSARKGDLRETLKERRGEPTATSKIGSEERRKAVEDNEAVELWRMYERLEKRLDAQNPYRQEVFSEVTPFSRRIMSCPLPENFKTPQVKAYNGTTDPQDHLARFGANVVMYVYPEEIKCRCFLATLEGQACDWFHKLPKGSIDKWSDLAHKFMEHFASSRRQKLPFSHLLNVKIRKGEQLREFINRWEKEARDVQGADDQALIAMLQAALPQGDVRKELRRNPLSTYQEMLARAKYLALEEDDDEPPVRKEKKSGPPVAEGKKRKDYGRGPNPTGYQASRHPVHAVQSLPAPPRSRESYGVQDAPKYCEYHCNSTHNTSECVMLKKEMDQLITRGPPPRPERPSSGNRTSRRPAAPTAAVTAEEGELGLSQSELKPIRTLLSGFTGDTIEAEGTITVKAGVGDGTHRLWLDMEFMVVQLDCAHHLILGRPGLEDLECVISPVHLCLKFSTPMGVGVAKGNQSLSRSCYVRATKSQARVDENAHPVHVLSQIPIGTLLRSLNAPSQVSKWGVFLGSFQIEFKPRPAIKGQALADFVVECTAREVESNGEELEGNWWIIYTDGLSATDASGGGVVGISPEEFKAYYSGGPSAEADGGDPRRDMLSSQRSLQDVQEDNLAGVFLAYDHQGLRRVRTGAGNNVYLVVAIDYFTKWVEAAPVPTITEEQMRKFVSKQILCHFGVPQQIITDNGTQFEAKGFNEFLQSWGIKHSYAAVGTTARKATGETPFVLTYGFEARAPAETSLLSYRVETFDAQENEENLRAKLHLIDERRERAYIRAENYRRQVKSYHDQRMRPRQFGIGDWVLRRREVSRPTDGGKFAKSFEGPYIIKEMLADGTFRLQTPAGGLECCQSYQILSVDCTPAMFPF